MTLLDAHFVVELTQTEGGSLGILSGYNTLILLVNLFVGLFKGHETSHETSFLQFCRFYCGFL